MKKTSINILCILIILIIGFSVMAPAFKFSSIFINGFMAGWEHAEVSADKIESELDAVTNTVPLDIAFIPDLSTFIQGNDSITFANGDSFPIIHDRASILVPDHEIPIYLSAGPSLLYLACLVLFVFLVIEFVKFVININRGMIFDIKNVKRLKRFSGYLISIAILKSIAGIFDDILFSRLDLTLEGYSMTAYWTIPWATLLLGLLALLMAQVWGRGLEMKEEQELTI